MTVRLFAVVLTALFATLSPAAEPEVIRLWPERAVGASTEKWVERGGPGVVDRSVGEVSDPILTVYFPERAHTPMPAVLVCPGGGYSHLAIDKEGHDIARWLNSIGVAAYVLKYRLPFRDGQPRPDGFREMMHDRSSAVKTLAVAVEDGEKAMRIIRDRTKRGGVDAERGVEARRIGVMGFSAGGHLAVLLATSADQAVRPDFVAPIYGVTLQNVQFPADAPPAFLAHAHDDPTVSPQESIDYYLATKQAGGAAELHIFLNGGHGFGLRKATGPVGDWPNRFEAWLRATGFLQ